jgi:hypothetical protein
MAVVDDDKKRHRRTEAQEWCFRLVNDPVQFEKERYMDTINDYNNLIAEFQKLYDNTPTTDHFIRARIQSGMKNRKETWQKL